MVVDAEFVGSVEGLTRWGPTHPAGNRLPDLARSSCDRPMANPRQRRKARSSQKPPFGGPKALQDVWDKHKTIRQNYAALSLSVSLNPSASGGAERAAPVTQARTTTNEVAFIDSLEPAPLMSGGVAWGASQETKPDRLVAVETGNDIGSPLPTRERNLVEEAAAAAILSSEYQSWVSLGHMPGTEDPIIRALPDVHSVPVVSRFSSKGEVTFLQKLISRHGSDVEAMARDRKLNPDQRTEGELRRAIRRASGG
ncbi:ribosome biogenesis protein Nop16 [Lactarius indigo]|nr:ribosome biogenesis protein Nop16 [Lactarius indigo]